MNLLFLYLIITTLLCVTSGKTQNLDNPEVREKKVDYLERIYFCGGNKSEIGILIVATIQELEEKPSTSAVAKQYLFLTGIKDKIGNAKNSCDALELIASGIYGIDANEALIQHIKPPSESAKSISLGSLSNALNTVRSTTSDSSSAMRLGGGTATAMSKVNGSTNKAAEAINTAGKAKEVIGVVADMFHLKKDKPCKDVPKKTIEIGSHVVPTLQDSIAAGMSANSKTGDGSLPVTMITIKNISYKQLAMVANNLEKITGIKSVDSDNYNDNTAVIGITHNIKTKLLIDKIIETNKELKLNVEKISSEGVTMFIK